MKKIMLVLILAALAAVGLFGQEKKFDWNDPSQSIGVDVRVLKPSKQIPVSGVPYIDSKTGLPVPVIESYRVDMIIPVIFRDETILPGYTRIILNESPQFTIVTKEKDGKINVSTSTACYVETFKDQNNDEFLVARFVLPTNYITAYITLPAELKPISELSQEFKTFVIGGFSYEPSQFMIPNKSNLKSDNLNLKPAKENTGGLR